MLQQEIEDAVRQATRGRWMITTRSPRSAIAEITVDAAAVRAEVQRLQFTEHYQILAIAPAEETWTLTVTTASGRVAWSMEIDIVPEHSDTIDGPTAIIQAYNQLGTP